MRRKLTYDPARDYYIVLGIEASATSEEIRQAYRLSVRRVHPDVNPDRADWATGQIQLVNEAYDVLGSPARRRQYDRMRWLYVPVQPEQERRSPFVEPTYDYNRPWWDQMAERAPRDYPPADDPARGRQAAPLDHSQPFWSVITNWLNVGRLERFWLTLIGLWRGPYVGVLTVLTVAFGINVAAVIYVANSPQRWASVQEWFEARNSEAVTISATPDRLVRACPDPGVQIKTPFWGDEVGDRFSIYGTAHHADMWSYTLMVGFIGDFADTPTPPTAWIPARQPPPNQSFPDPAIEDGLLTDTPVDLSGQSAGFYAIRLRVILRNGQALPPCDVIVLHS